MRLIDALVRLQVILGITACSLLLVGAVQAAETSPRASVMMDGIEVRDPTRPLDWLAERTPPSRENVTRPKLRISSILISPVRRLAIINGRSMAEGDKIAGATVQRVSADGVRLSWKGEQWTAQLATSNSAVRKPARAQP